MTTQSNYKKQQDRQSSLEQWKDVIERIFQLASVVLVIVRTLLEILHFGHTIGLW